MREIISYSAALKKELTYLEKDKGRHCLIAELYALMRTSANIFEKSSVKIIVLNSDNLFLAIRFAELIHAAFGFRAEVSVRTSSKSKKRHYLVFISGEDAKRVQKAMESAMILKQLCCKQAYLRGVFLACASICNPGKNYHLEYVFSDKDIAHELMEVFTHFEISSRLIMRKKSHVLYIKDGEKISQVLGLIGARKHLLDFESLRVFKTVSNEVNRKVNCETANIAKTAKAFVSFQEDIEYIERVQGIRSLPGQLIEVATLKIEHPGATLKEIGEMLNPPISKSGVNHRLRKISKIADKLRG